MGVRELLGVVQRALFARNLFTIDVHHDAIGKAGVAQGLRFEWEALVREAVPKGLVAAIFKAGDGGPAPGDPVMPHAAFVREWPRMKAAGLRHRGSYWWLRTFAGCQPARAQAEAYARQLERAGGLDATDLHPAYDIEGEPGTHDRARTEAMALEACGRLGEITGRPVGLYTKSALFDLGANFRRMGGRWNWTAGYSDRMSSRLAEVGIARRDVLLWQYTNGVTNLTTFPRVLSPTFGPCDTSVFLGRETSEAGSYDLFRRYLTADSGPGAVALAAVGVALVASHLG